MVLVPPTSEPQPGAGLVSGALPTLVLVSGVAQAPSGNSVLTNTPVTLNPTADAAATCTVELSPDGTTFTTIGVATAPLGVALDGTVHIIAVQVPAGWRLRMTVVNAVLGTTTFA